MDPIKEKPKVPASKVVTPKMTRELAEARAVGDSKRPKFDGTAFLAKLKK
jgi:hypothetical protein